MIQRGENLCFAFEAHQSFFVLGYVRAKDLDSNFTNQLFISRSAALTHSAWANLADNGVVRERRVGGNCFAQALMLTKDRWKSTT
jgi:hypothetical protein